MADHDEEDEDNGAAAAVDTSAAAAVAAAPAADSGAPAAATEAPVPGQLTLDMHCKSTKTTLAVQIGQGIDLTGDVGTVGRFTPRGPAGHATLHLQGYALEGYLTRGSTLLVLDVGSQKNQGKAKITSVIDHYFHVEKETMVTGETVLEGIGLTTDDVEQLQTSADVMKTFSKTSSASKGASKGANKTSPAAKKPKVAAGAAKAAKKAPKAKR